MSAYQSQVNTVPGIGVEGDFVTQNPRQTALAGPGGFVAGTSGLNVGLWGWASYQGIDPDNAPTIINNFGGGGPSGIICREQQGLNTTYLLDASQFIPTGFPVTLFVVADLLVVNRGTTAAVRGQKCYANNSNGQSSFASTGAAGTASISASIAAGNGAVTGYVIGNVLTVLTLTSGTVALGSLVTGTIGGSGVTAGSFIVAQLSGSANGTGTYALNTGEQSVGGTGGGSLTLTFGILSVGTLTSGQIYVNGSLGAAGVSSSTLITQNVSGGTAGGSVWYVTNTQTVSAGTTITVGQTVETAFYALSGGQVGELIKISRQYLTT
jgi:hypothetical protein